MTRKELLALISEIRSYQSKLDNVEVKSAHKGTPQRLYEPLSAFANRSTGGVILFGLNEKTPRGERFLDNRKFEGSIPEMVDNAVNYIMASIRKGSLIKGLYREDYLSIPKKLCVRQL